MSTFRQLHESGCFVIPNPWDIGSARLLQQLGFKALATTSSGFAWSMGRQDNHVTLDEALGHFRAIAGGVEIPVNADFEGGFADAPGGRGEARVGCGGDRRRWPVDRGLQRRARRSALRVRAVGRSRARGAPRHRRERPSACCSPRARKVSSSDGRISSRRSGGSPPMPTPAPIACMPPASARSMTSAPSSPQWRPNR